jgi:sporulation integral membrane protein YlbJ
VFAVKARDAFGPALAALATLVLIVAMLANPRTVVAASSDGARLWWEILFPSLLPFFVGAKLLMATGAVHVVGALLEGFMRPLFAIPGAGAFVFLMGFASSYPLASILAVDLLRRRQCTAPEAQRMVLFFTTADPLFITGAVAVGMFVRPGLAPVLAASHYLAALVIALIAARLTPSAERRSTGSVIPSARHALTALREARRQDGRPFGKLLADAVSESVATLLMIGGLVMLFSVLTALLDQGRLLAPIAAFMGRALSPLGLAPEAGRAAAMGVFEVTLGSRAAAALDLPLRQKVVLASILIAWGGLSIHTQVAGIVHGSGIRLGPALAARALHACLAGLIAGWLMARQDIVRAMFEFGPAAGPGTLSFVTSLTWGTAGFLRACAALMALSWLAALVTRRGE